MAIKSGRVGVKSDQVDAYGRIVLTGTLVQQISDTFNLPLTVDIDPVVPFDAGVQIPVNATTTKKRSSKKSKEE